MFGLGNEKIITQQPPYGKPDSRKALLLPPPPPSAPTDEEAALGTDNAATGEQIAADDGRDSCLWSLCYCCYDVCTERDQEDPNFVARRRTWSFAKTCAHCMGDCFCMLLCHLYFRFLWTLITLLFIVLFAFIWSTYGFLQPTDGHHHPRPSHGSS